MMFSLALGAIIVAASVVLVVGGAAAADTEQRAEPERNTNVRNLRSYRAKRLAGERKTAAPFGDGVRGVVLHMGDRRAVKPGMAGDAHRAAGDAA